MLAIPWLKKFYSSSGLSNIDAYKLIKNVVKNIRYYIDNPEEIYSADTDMFNEKLEKKFKFSEDLKNHHLIIKCLKSCDSVIVKQYCKYDNLELNDEFEDAAKSSRAHNIDAETVMGMYSAAQIAPPNATVFIFHVKLIPKKWNISIYRRYRKQRQIYYKY